MDEADISSRFESELNERQLANHRNRKREQPDFDKHGTKICIECGGTIPEARAKLDFVVRCIYCQEEEERNVNR